MDKLLEIEMGYWNSIFSELGDYIDTVLTANDLGGQTKPIVSPSMYRKYIKPRQKKLNFFIRKKKPSFFIFFHSCRSIYDFIPSLIEIGVAIISPVQVSADKMNTKKLKKEFGDALTFWERRINDLAPGGGIRPYSGA